MTSIQWPFITDPYCFDPNETRYRCLCNMCHSKTGVLIIAGLICVTVLMEVWHVGWHILARGTTDGIFYSVLQLGVGVFLSASLIYAISKEKAAYLLPYLLLQAVGLAAGFVILFALIYVAVVNDVAALRSLFDSQNGVPGPYGNHTSSYQVSALSNAQYSYLSHQNFETALRNFSQAKAFIEGPMTANFGDVTAGSPLDAPANPQQQPRYMGWMIVLSCVIVIALQFWLISIVFACWRFFRDKRAYSFAKGYNSYVVLRPSYILDTERPSQVMDENTFFRRILRSVSLDELSKLNQPARYRSHSTFTAFRNGHKLSSISYDCSAKQTVFLS